MEKTEAMVLHRQREELVAEQIELAPLSDNDILIKVGACAVCRTDLHVIDGDLKHPHLPLVPGHEIVGHVAACGSAVMDFSIGDRVAVPWLGATCLECRFCKSGRENLCESPTFTGYTRNGGYADFTIADARFSYKLSQDYANYSDEQVAPLLCAGLIGWRSFKFATRGKYEADGRKLGIYGFGAAGHLIMQVANHFGWRSFVFTREGDKEGQDFSMRMGAAWAGASGDMPPEPLDASIVFAPVGLLVPIALRALDRGGILVCGGIHMSDIPQFSYDLLWQERTVCSVANLTRQDGREFLELAAKIPVKAEIRSYSLGEANEALQDLRSGKLNGAAVLVMRDLND